MIFARLYESGFQLSGIIKAKPKSDFLANHKRSGPANEPIRPFSKYDVAGAKRGKTLANKTQFNCVINTSDWSRKWQGIL